MQFTSQPGGGARYVTSQGDCLDLIAFNYYGTHEGTTELLYEANRELASVAQPFEAGVAIVLPAAAVRPAKPQIQLWD